jgi:hypothetical protein
MTRKRWAPHALHRLIKREEDRLKKYNTLRKVEYPRIVNV